MDNNKNRRRSRVDHRGYENDHRVRVGHLEKEMTAVKGEINGLSLAMTAQSAKLTGVQEQIGNVARYLEKMADRVNEPRHINWGWVIAALMGFIAIGGGFTSVVVEPLRYQSAAQREEIRVLEKNVTTLDRKIAYLEGRSEER